MNNELKKKLLAAGMTFNGDVTNGSLSELCKVVQYAQNEARLEEALWWREQIDPKWIHEDDCNCAWCQRVRALKTEDPK